MFNGLSQVIVSYWKEESIRIQRVKRSQGLFEVETYTTVIDTDTNLLWASVYLELMEKVHFVLIV